MRELRSVTADGDEPPEFEDWGDLLVDGVKLFVVTLIYVVPAVLVFLVLGMGGSVMDGMDPGILVSFGSLASAVVLLIVYYVLPGVYAHFSVGGSIGSALEFDELRRLLENGDYARTWLAALGIAILGGFAAFLLQLTVVGVVLLPFL